MTERAYWICDRCGMKIDASTDRPEIEFFTVKRRLIFWREVRKRDLDLCHACAASLEKWINSATAASAAP